MLAALITLSGAGEEPSAAFGGWPLECHQADLALRLGCRLIIADGSAASAQARALRRLADGWGARFEVLAGGHALPGLLGSADCLLVLQPGLLPQLDQAEALLARPEPVVLVMPAEGAVEAGFERIDRTRAFAGAMRIPAPVVAQVLCLPDDSALVPALLRLALQHHVPAQPVPELALARGDWGLVRGQQAAERLAPLWLAQRLGRAPAWLPGRWRGRALGRPVGGRPRRSKGGPPGELQRWRGALGLVGAGLIAGALLLAGAGLAAASFAFLALGLPLLLARDALGRLEFAGPGRAAPWGPPRRSRAPAGQPGAGSANRRWRMGRWRIGRLPVARLVDLALVACAVAALEGPWYRQALAPLVLFMGLALLDRRAAPRPAQALGDRTLVAALAALGLALFPAEPVLAGLALLLLAGTLVPGRWLVSRRITAG